MLLIGEFYRTVGVHLKQNNCVKIASSCYQQSHCTFVLYHFVCKITHIHIKDSVQLSEFTIKWAGKVDKLSCTYRHWKQRKKLIGMKITENKLRVELQWNEEEPLCRQVEVSGFRIGFLLEEIRFDIVKDKRRERNPGSGSGMNGASIFLIWYYYLFISKYY